MTFTLGIPFVDVDEERGSPAPHRYVHGGFAGNETRFSIYFPPASRYEGRFLHFLEGGLGGDEHASNHHHHSLGSIMDFAFACGAYLVESNQGHAGVDLSGSAGDPRVHSYLASAESARFARRLSADMYGAPPHHGYVFGGSGGGHRAIVCLENGPDVWDGAVPFVVASAPGAAAPVTWSATAHAMLTLSDRIDDIVAATEPGGSGDPFVDGLTSQQRETLANLYRMGFPRGAERDIANDPRIGLWALFAPEIVSLDPDYFETAFWTSPGFAGADRSTDVERFLVDREATITSVVKASQVGSPWYPGRDPDTIAAIGIDPPELASVLGARMTVLTGQEAGRRRYRFSVAGDVVHALTTGPGDVWGDVAVGDKVRIDNMDFLAFCYWHRHQPPDVLASLGPYGHVDGSGIYPQRKPYIFDVVEGVGKTGAFAGKMIILQHTMDTGGWPVDALFYEGLARAHHGEQIGDHLRLWWTDNAAHSVPSLAPQSPPPVPSCRIIDFVGLVQQAIHDLIDWVEFGVAPARDTSFRYDDNHRLVLPGTAAQRCGIQPVVSLTVNDGSCVQVAPGDNVVFEICGACPPGGGTVIAAEIDVDGAGSWQLSFAGLTGIDTEVRLGTTHRYRTEGTYYPAARITSHRDGDTSAQTRRLMNLARCRVVVAAKAASTE